MQNNKEIKKENEKEEIKTENKNLKVVYLIILIILLIFTFVISFKTGETIYYLVNTNPENKNTNTVSDIATWNFEVRIEY